MPQLDAPDPTWIVATVPHPDCSFPSEELNALARRHCHDVRNLLSGLTVELAMLEEGPSPQEITESVEKMWREIRRIDLHLQAFSGMFADEEPLVMPAAGLAEMWRTDAEKSRSQYKLEWDISTDDAIVSVPARIARHLFQDVLFLTARMSSENLKVKGTQRDGTAVFSISPPPGSDGIRALDESDTLMHSALCRLAGRAGMKLDKTPGIAGPGSLQLTISCVL